MGGMLDPSRVSYRQLRPLRRAEYDRLVELGAFEDERLELLGGLLVFREPQGALHAGVLGWLSNDLIPKLNGRAHARIQAPLALSDESEPEPDIALVAPGDYRREHPSAAMLVIEVADSSLGKDKRIKAPLYAAAGIPEYWVVNLRERVLEVYRAPNGEAYRELRCHGTEESVAPLAFPDLEISVRDLIGDDPDGSP